MSIHVNYAKLTPRGKEIVDEVYEDTRNSINYGGLRAVGDDRAEKLVEAIATYIIESNPEKHNVLLEKEPA